MKIENQDPHKYELEQVDRKILHREKVDEYASQYMASLLANYTRPLDMYSLACLAYEAADAFMMKRQERMD